MEQVTVDPALWWLISTIIGVLLGVIAFFITRLIKHSDINAAKLGEKLGQLSDTIARVDRERSEHAITLGAKLNCIEEKIGDVDSYFDGLRALEDRGRENIKKLEERIAKIEVSGCSKHRCCEK